MKATKIMGVLLIFLLILSAIAGGFWYWYDHNVDRSGWVEKDGTIIYQDFHAVPVTGWMELEGSTYYFQPGGVPHTGWFSENGNTYCFDVDGTMITGWKKLDGNIHYFGGNGVMVEGWLWLEDRYYFQNGAMVTGWQSIDGNRHFFGEDGRLTMGFAEVGGSIYYFGDDGCMRTGIVEIDDHIYNFQNDGILFTGWEETESGSRYYQQDGTMALGWTEIDGQRYFFNSDGYVQKAGWMRDGEYRYYILEDGTYAVGPTVIDGQTHYFTPDGIEVILVNALNPVPSFFERELVNVIDYHDVDKRCYDALIEMLADCKAAGNKYIFNSAYRTLTEQTSILEYRTLEHMRDFKLDFLDARKKALETVAIPGTSEHHLGLAVDLLGDDAIAWLTEHCWEYGFIVRYTKDKEAITGIIDEPWHFRYVGTRVSLAMKDTGLCLEEYLGAPAVTQKAVEALHADKWYEETFTTVDEETVAKYIGT